MLKKTIIISILFLLLILYLLFGQYFNIHIDCPFYELTNFYCPGCGITRMLKSLIELDFYQAFRYNMLVFLMLPILFIYATLQIRYYITGKENILNQKRFNKFWIILAVITILFGILRNIDCFSFLEPIKI